MSDRHAVTVMFEARYDEAQHRFNQEPTRENGEALDAARAAMRRAREDERKWAGAQS